MFFLLNWSLELLLTVGFFYLFICRLWILERNLGSLHYNMPPKRKSDFGNHNQNWFEICGQASIADFLLIIVLSLPLSAGN